VGTVLVASESPEPSGPDDSGCDVDDADELSADATTVDADCSSPHATSISAATGTRRTGSRIRERRGMARAYWRRTGERTHRRVLSDRRTRRGSERGRLHA
jgi:hypothetical protein